MDGIIVGVEQVGAPEGAPLGEENVGVLLGLNVGKTVVGDAVGFDDGVKLGKIVGDGKDGALVGAYVKGGI